MPASVSGNADVSRVENARAGSGYVQFQGQLPVKPDADSCVYVVCGDTVYEAFCLEDEGFAVNVPEGTAPRYVICNIGGLTQMFEI